MPAYSSGGTGGPPSGARPDPSFQQLRLFLLLAEELHFGRAAARAYISQPAFSKQIRTLEKRLGVDLAERNSTSCRLTDAGTRLVAYARTALRAREDMAALTCARPLTLQLAAIGGELSMPYTHEVLARLARDHPHVHVETRGVDFVEQVSTLRRGTVDAAFLRPPLPPDLEGVTLAHEPRVACLPATDPLARRDSVSVHELADHTVLDVPPDAPRAWWNFWTANPRPDGTPVRYGAVCRDLEAAVLAVTQGRGIVFLPAASREFLPRPGLAYVGIHDLPPTTAALMWSTARRDDPAVTIARQAALRAAAEHE